MFSITNLQLLLESFSDGKYHCARIQRDALNRHPLWLTLACVSSRALNSPPNASLVIGDPDSSCTAWTGDAVLRSQAVCGGCHVALIFLMVLMLLTL